MVRAILLGTKTQTRRVVKPSDLAWMDENQGMREPCNVERCTYGKPGDWLWVRETHSIGPGPGVQLVPGEGAGSLRWPHVTFTADGTVERRNERWSGEFGKRRPSIHMPRWASRITLEITGVRVERLQDISEADAIAEGCRADAGLHGDDDLAVAATAMAFDQHHGRLHSVPMPNVRYAVLWESINGPGSWDANPWVWVIEFNRVTT